MLVTVLVLISDILVMLVVVVFIILDIEVGGTPVVVVLSFAISIKVVLDAKL